MTSPQNTHTITVYSTTSCPYCHMVKDFLDAKGVPYRDMNVGIDRAAAMEMVKKSGQMGVPVIDIDGNIVVGFRPDAIEKLIA